MPMRTSASPTFRHTTSNRNLLTRPLAAAALLAFGLAATTSFSHAQEAAQPSQPPAPSGRLAELAWLRGGWEGELFGQPAEEHWTAAKGTSMVGMFRLGGESGRQLYELLLIEETADGVAMRLRHFGAQFRPLENEPRVYKLSEAGNERIVFDCDGEDRVQRIAYHREGKDALRVELTMRSEDGPRVESARWTRIKCD